MKPSEENALRVVAALAEFGAPLHGTTVVDLADPGFILQIGVQPVRIDVITSIDGLIFDVAWPQRLNASFAGEPVGVLSREHLIVNKVASGRPQDLADVHFLRSMRHDKESGGT